MNINQSINIDIDIEELDRKNNEVNKIIFELENKLIKLKKKLEEMEGGNEGFSFNLNKKEISYLLNEELNGFEDISLFSEEINSILREFKNTDKDTSIDKDNIKLQIP